MSAYLSAVLADSPSHYWRLADPGGAIAHDIGSTRIHLEEHLTAASVAGLSYSGPISDGGSFFTDRGIYLTSLGTTQLPSLPFSVEMWFWSFGFTTTDLLAGQDNSANGGWEMFVGPAQLNFKVGAASSLVLLPAAPLQTWHHAVMAADAATVLSYLDGVQVATTPTGVFVPVTHSYTVGWNAGRTASLEGFLSEVAYYGTKLSAARVAAHYAARDNATQPPVSGAPGGLTGGGSIQYTSNEALILASVRKSYSGAP